MRGEGKEKTWNKRDAAWSNKYYDVMLNIQFVARLQKIPRLSYGNNYSRLENK